MLVQRIIKSSHSRAPDKRFASLTQECDVHVQTLESELFLETGKLLTLSEQAYVNCVDNPDHCGGTGE
jgi:hypothetical protein